SDESAEYLLTLADRFQMACVLDRVEQFLISSDDFSNLEKMRMADEYKLFELLNHCLFDLTEKEDFKEVRNSSIYNGLSNETKSLLFERRIKIDK
ncbi:hypothetical protein PMAYCL1PPCAC_24886, partial [Pristionchus mayeri]